MEVVDDDWTSVIDDIDRLGLSDNACPLIPLSKLHRGEKQISAAVFSDDVEESKGQVAEEKMQLVVEMAPAFGLKELSVYADPDLLVQTGKKYNFEVTESVFNKIEIDETKCQKYRKDSHQIKIIINYKANLETCEYDRYI